MVLLDKAKMLEMTTGYGAGFVKTMVYTQDLIDLMNRKIRHCRIGKVTDKHQPREIRLPDANPTKCEA